MFIRLLLWLKEEGRVVTFQIVWHQTIWRIKNEVEIKIMVFEIFEWIWFWYWEQREIENGSQVSGTWCMRPSTVVHNHNGSIYFMNWAYQWAIIPVPWMYETESYNMTHILWVIKITFFQWREECKDVSEFEYRDNSKIRIHKSLRNTSTILMIIAVAAISLSIGKDTQNSFGIRI